MKLAPACVCVCHKRGNTHLLFPSHLPNLHYLSYQPLTPHQTQPGTAMLAVTTPQTVMRRMLAALLVMQEREQQHVVPTAVVHGQQQQQQHMVKENTMMSV